MKLLLVVLLVSLCCTVQADDADTYPDRYDSINVDEVLANKRLLAAYIKCVLDKGRCTAEGKELKSHITDALQTGCKKCTETQRSGVRKVIKHLINEEPEYWKQLVEMYDPKKVFTHKYEKELRSIKE